MGHQVDDRVLEVAMESSVWNLPHLDGAVLGGAGDDVIVMRTPLNVEDSGLVSSHNRSIAIYSTNLTTQSKDKFI